MLFGTWSRNQLRRAQSDSCSALDYAPLLARYCIYERHSVLGYGMTRLAGLAFSNVCISKISMR